MSGSGDLSILSSVTSPGVTDTGAIDVSVGAGLLMSCGFCTVCPCGSLG